MLHELTEFKIHGQDDFTTLNAPSGISVTSDAIYIKLDKNNNRINNLNYDFELIDEFGTPEDPTFDEAGPQTALKLRRRQQWANIGVIAEKRIGRALLN